jgi:hypothetical protein
MTEPRPTSEAELTEQIRSLDARAPASLHRRVESMIADAGARRGGRSVAGRDRVATRGGGDRVATRGFRLGPRLAAAGAIAAVVVALAIAIGFSGGSSTLSVRDASAPTLLHATAPPPRESSSNRRRLTASVDGVAFPYWGKRLGWRATGMRSDSIDGRKVTTVFYANRKGQRIGYAIVAGSAPAQVSGGVVSMRDGTPYRLLTVKDTAVVTWLRDGRMCVVSGHGVSGAKLLALASWDDHRSVTS